MQSLVGYIRGIDFFIGYVSLKMHYDKDSVVLMVGRGIKGRNHNKKYAVEQAT